jgi:hypothetical protein
LRDAANPISRHRAYDAAEEARSMMLLMRLRADLVLDVAGRGLEIGAYRNGRVRPDGILASLDAFVGPNPAVTVVGR